MNSFFVSFYSYYFFKERFESPSLPKDLNEGFELNEENSNNNNEPSIIPLLKGIKESSLMVSRDHSIILVLLIGINRVSMFIL